MPEHTCIFCRIVAGKLASEKILDNETVMVIKDIAPKAPIHYLIIPKTHKQTMKDLNEHDDVLIIKDMVGAVRSLAETLAHPQAFTIISNNGVKAGQTVPHLHWHFLAGKNLYQNGFSL